jgi:hypothetical protein
VTPRRRPCVRAGHRAGGRAVLLLAAALAAIGAGAPRAHAGEPLAVADAAASVGPDDAAAFDVDPGGAELANRTTLGLGAAATFDPASPSFEAELRHFVGPHVALGLRQEGGFTAGRDARWHLATSAFADLHPLDDPKPLLSPFVGVAGGALYGGSDAAGTVGPEAGVALFLADGLSLEARCQFRWVASAARVGGLDREQHLAWLGVRFVLPDRSGEDFARAEASAARAEEAAAKAEQAVARLEAAVERLERAVDAYAAWFEEQLRK